MAYKTLLEFATDRNLFILLAKERAKYLKRNDNAKKHKLDKSTDIFELLDDKQNRILLSRLMPPRYKWVRPKKRKVKSNNFLAARKLAEKSLLLLQLFYLFPPARIQSLRYPHPRATAVI